MADLAADEAAFLGLREAPSPNSEPRRPAPDGAAAPRLVILHHTAMANAADALARLRDPAAKVSAHYLIAPDGGAARLVAETQRAWHAGVAHWAGADDVNSLSIGVELAHPGPLGAAAGAPFGPPYPEPQIAALERLLASILRRWRLPPAAVLAHSDVAPGRKRDPGPLFDWARLGRRGLAARAPVAPPALNAPLERGAARRAEAFRRDLRSLGYGDWPLRDLVDAFRLRWRPFAAARRLEESPAAPGDADLRAAAQLAAELAGVGAPATSLNR